jgi:hypothetical protein
MKNKIIAVSSSTAKMFIRNKDNGKDEVILNRGKAIRHFCLECCGWSMVDVNECASEYCPLFAFRFGGSCKAALKKTEKIELSIAKREEKELKLVQKKLKKEQK